MLLELNYPGKATIFIKGSVSYPVLDFQKKVTHSLHNYWEMVLFWFFSGSPLNLIRKGKEIMIRGLVF